MVNRGSRKYARASAVARIEENYCMDFSEGFQAIATKSVKTDPTHSMGYSR